MKLMKQVFYGLLISGMLAQAAFAQLTYTGRHSVGASSSFAIELATDGSAVKQIIVTDLACGTDSRHTFTLAFNPNLTVTDNRFAAQAIPVTITPDPGHAHTLDIDGVLFDADGNGAKEQALGGLSFVSGVNRCNFRWWATSVVADDDGDGWSDTAERRLGSEYRRQTAFGFGVNSTPEHQDVPTTSIYGPCPCRDFLDNDNFADGDGRKDGAEKDSPGDVDQEPDCASPLPPAQPSPLFYTGRYLSGGAANSFSLEISADGLQVVQIAVSSLACGSHQHTFALKVDVAITNNRFSATVPVSITPDPGHAHTLNIDGVFFDGDGDGTKEQALGGLVFISGLTRCPLRWWATAIAPDDDGDGWSDTAEQRLGSEPRRQTAFGFGINSMPEHRDVPTTPLLGPDVCNDADDNDNFADRDGKFDLQEADGPDLDLCLDCSATAAAPSNLTARAISSSLIRLMWTDKSNNESGFHVERKTGNGGFTQIAIVLADVVTFDDRMLNANTAYT